MELFLCYFVCLVYNIREEVLSVGSDCTETLKWLLGIVLGFFYELRSFAHLIV